jgi:hypothetical protein
MVFAEDIRRTILQLAEERGPRKTFGPCDVAKLVDRHNPHALIEQVQFVASVLVKEGKIASIAGSKENSAEHLRFRKAKTS